MKARWRGSERARETARAASWETHLTAAGALQHGALNDQEARAARVRGGGGGGGEEERPSARPAPDPAPVRLPTRPPPGAAAVRGRGGGGEDALCGRARRRQSTRAGRAHLPCPPPLPIPGARRAALLTSAGGWRCGVRRAAGALALCARPLPRPGCGARARSLSLHFFLPSLPASLSFSLSLSPTPFPSPPQAHGCPRLSRALALSPVGSTERCEPWEAATPPPAKDLPPGPARPLAQPCPARGGRRRRRGRTDG